MHNYIYIYIYLYLRNIIYNMYVVVSLMVILRCGEVIHMIFKHAVSECLGSLEARPRHSQKRTELVNVKVRREMTSLWNFFPKG